MFDLVSKTLLDYYMDAGDYSPAEQAAIQQDIDVIFSNLSKGKTPNLDSKELFNIVGVPGSGKSTLARSLLGEESRKYTFILIRPIPEHC